jgi:hypothetical protein
MSVNTTVEELPTSQEQPVVEEVQTQSPVAEESTNTEVTSQNVAQDGVKEIPITEVVIDNDVIGLNLLIAFGQIAHKRGAYNIEETAKLHEAIQYFARKLSAPAPPVPTEGPSTDL